MIDGRVNKWISSNSPEGQDQHFHQKNKERICKRGCCLNFLFKFSEQTGKELTEESVIDIRHGMAVSYTWLMGAAEGR